MLTESKQYVIRIAVYIEHNFDFTFGEQFPIKP